MTTRILALADASGNLVRFRLMPGNRCDSVDVPPLIEGIAFEGLIADKAFDSNVVVAELDPRGAKVALSINQWRHLAEIFFCKLKEFKLIAMRACKTDRTFEGMIYLAAGVTNSR